MGLKLLQSNTARLACLFLFPSPCGVMGLKRIKLICGSGKYQLFPSPCGVMGLKLQPAILHKALSTGLTFPSPCGVMGLKLWLSLFSLSVLFTAFPSPCGVMGLKRILVSLFALLIAASFGVSVPLRGNGFETPARKNKSCKLGCNEVSVPLRGNGFETQGDSLSSNQNGKLFPSPCGVMGLKPLVGLFFGIMLLILGFPSPCGVMGLKLSSNVSVKTTADSKPFPSPCGVMGLKQV